MSRLLNGTTRSNNSPTGPVCQAAPRPTIRPSERPPYLTSFRAISLAMALDLTKAANTFEYSEI